MKHTIYNTDIQLVEITREVPFGPDKMTEVWKWEIIIAVHETTYKGTASEKNRKMHLPWRELRSEHPLTEMIDACKRHMDKK